MMSKIVIVVLAVIAVANCGVVPAAYISPYASTYNAHTINHAVAAPFVAAPAAKIVASPYHTAALPYSLPYSAAYASPYSAAYAAPYSSAFASPYAYSHYSGFPGTYSHYL